MGGGGFEDIFSFQIRIMPICCALRHVTGWADAAQSYIVSRVLSVSAARSVAVGGVNGGAALVRGHGPTAPQLAALATQHPNQLRRHPDHAAARHAVGL